MGEDPKNSTERESRKKMSSEKVTITKKLNFPSYFKREDKDSLRRKKGGKNNLSLHSKAGNL